MAQAKRQRIAEGLKEASWISAVAASAYDLQDETQRDNCQW